MASETCTVKAVIDYIVKTERKCAMRRLKAIKTSSVLKISDVAASLFSGAVLHEGAFNTRWIWMIRRYRTAPVNTSVQQSCWWHLFEYACTSLNDAGEQVSPKLEQQIRKSSRKH